MRYLVLKYKLIKGYSPYINIYQMSKPLTIKKFIEDARRIHGDKYDYSKVDLDNRDEKGRVCIICPKHGEFWQRPSCHISMKQGCQKCKGEKLSIEQRSNTDDFIKKARIVHGDKYDYSKAKYIKSNIKVIIVCPKHGEFKTRPNDHLNGKGCPLCNESHLETEIRVLLDENGIKYEQWKHFSCLGKQTLDFYLPEYKIGIECQGGQHFKVVEHFGGKNKFKRTRELDINKKNFCNEKNIKLLYYSNLLDYKTFLGEKIFHNKNKLLIEIEQNGRK